MALNGCNIAAIGISMGLLTPKIPKFPEPENSSIVAGFVGKNVSRCHNVNQYHTTPIIRVANAIISPVFGRSLLLIIDMACILYFQAMYTPTKNTMNATCSSHINENRIKAKYLLQSSFVA